MKVIKRWFSLLSILLLLGSCQSEPAIHFPGESWLMYENPGEEGWSAELLTKAEALSDSLNVATILIVENGIVVDAWGELDRRFMCHSVRKSFLSALIGIYAGNGTIDLDETIESLGIDDKDTLTDAEKEATVADLLKARSGIYHSAAYETEAMKARRPARGSHSAGCFYYYNNWDFNVLAHIFEMKTGTDAFTAFKKEIAGPLQMEDFRMEDTYFHLEPENSIYPAYPFRLSTRDAARFGLLYLAEGKWNDEQIIPGKWIADSQVAYSDSVRTGRGYGYLWWIAQDDVLGKYGMYYASGVGGQTIAVLPKLDLVIVQRVNTYRGENVSYPDMVSLFSLIIEAKTGRESANPITRTMVSNVDERLPLQQEFLSRMVGRYARDEEAIEILAGPFGKLLLETNEGQKYHIVNNMEGSYMLEDAEVPFVINSDKLGKVINVELYFPNDTLQLLPVKRQ